jgi:hypothetical protein
MPGQSLDYQHILSNVSFSNNPISALYNLQCCQHKRFRILSLGENRIRGKTCGSKAGDQQNAKETSNRILHHRAIRVRLTEHNGHVGDTRDDVI